MPDKVFENSDNVLRLWANAFKRFEKEMRKVPMLSENEAKALRNPIRIKR